MFSVRPRRGRDTVPAQNSENCTFARRLKSDVTVPHGRKVFPKNWEWSISHTSNFSVLTSVDFPSSESAQGSPRYPGEREDRVSAQNFENFDSSSLVKPDMADQLDPDVPWEGQNRGTSHLAGSAAHISPENVYEVPGGSRGDPKGVTR